MVCGAVPGREDGLVAGLRQRVHHDAAVGIQVLAGNGSQFGVGLHADASTDQICVDARTIGVQPFEKKMLNTVEKAIRDSDLGLNPSSQGDVIRVPTPALTEERRKEMVKLVKSEAEDAKIAIRNIRRDANESLKKLVKDKACSEDDERRASDEVQKLTDKFVIDVDKMVAEKEKEVLTV